MSVNGNIGAFITSADTIEIRFSDNEKLDVDHIDENNNEEFKEFRENENKKEELDYYIQKILNRNKDLKNIDFEEGYDEYELTEDYDLDEEHDIDEKYILKMNIYRKKVRLILIMKFMKVYLILITMKIMI